MFKAIGCGMFDHFSIGVDDLNRSLAFYDAALRALDASRMFSMTDRGIAVFSGIGGTSFRIGVDYLKC